MFQTFKLRRPRERAMIWLSSMKPKASVLLDALPCRHQGGGGDGMLTCFQNLINGGEECVSNLRPKPLFPVCGMMIGFLNLGKGRNA